MVWTPVVVAAAIAVLPNPRGRYDTLIKQIAFFTNVGLLFILWVAYNQFENFLSTLQFEENVQWLPAIGAAYHLGVDGPGMVMLIATMALYAGAGGLSFDMDVLLKTPLSPRVQLAIGAALVIAGATRLPLFPFHGWVRDVYSDAPVGVSVVIAGSASRLGAY